MDLIILLVIMVLIVIFFKDLKYFIYGLGIIEIFFRILTFIKLNIGVPEISSLIAKYIPSSIIEIIGRYSTGLFYTILIWAFLISMICLEVYLVKNFFKRK